MRRRGVLLASGLLAGGLLAGCGGSAPHGDLTLGDDSFAPLSLTVTPGAVVTVANPSDQTHDVVVMGGLVKTMAIKPGGSTSFVAPSKPGSYTLTCDFHVDMRATLVVS